MCQDTSERQDSLWQRSSRDPADDAWDEGQLRSPEVLSQPNSRSRHLIEACWLLQAQNKRCVPILATPVPRLPHATGTGSALPRKHGCPGHRDTKILHSPESGARMRCGCARAASDPGSRRGAGAERTAAQTRPPTRARTPARRRDDNGAATTAAPARRQVLILSCALSHLRSSARGTQQP